MKNLKLKTLKDLFPPIKDLNMACSCTACDEGLDCDIKIIKAEAIKRVKNCCPNDNIGGIPLRKNKRCIACERDIWFNNLTTEEDLK